MKAYKTAVAMLLVLLFPPSTSRSEPPVEVAVVINAANPMGSMTLDEVRSFYMKQKSSWPDGEKIRPVDTETDDAARTLFLGKVLKTNPTDLERHWLEIKYRSAESPPKRMEDEAGVLKYVGAFKGGIGFVAVSALELAKDKPIKVVLKVKK
ncbi:MAG: hypothetical protein KA712_14675 [Myxococcales bacterium]|nr:hypothetical protein [Myxococcales bacterium]